MVTQPSADVIQAAETAKTEFDDYPRFAVAADIRNHQRADFLDGRSYAPTFEYPKLDHLYDQPETAKVPVHEKRYIGQAAVLDLESARGSSIVPDAELEMYTDYHEMRLKRIALVHNAWLLGHAGSGGTVELAKRAFMDCNESLFGTIDIELAQGMIGAEVTHAKGYIPRDKTAKTIRDDVLSYFKGHELQTEEPELLNPSKLQKLHDYVVATYADVLAVVPDTDETVIYDVEQCREIMQRALAAGGLESQGWTVKISDTASGVTTNSTSKAITLPVGTRRSASALKRLILHEQEVHARRGQNGEYTGRKLLKNGSANYTDVEEGLGLILECAVDNEIGGPAIQRARDRYITAGLALGVDGPARDARQTFGVLWRMLAIRNSKDGHIDEPAITAAKQQAYDHIENAFRGTNYAMPGIIYTKLKVYYEGLKKNADYFTEHIDELDTVFPTIMRGKYDHTDPVESQRVDELLAV